MANEQPSQTRRSKKAPKKPKKKGSVGAIFLKIFVGLIFLICLAFLSGVGLFWYYAKDAPKISDDKLDAPISSKFYTSDGEIFADLGSEKREKIASQDVPQLLEDAVVSVEDRRFYNHIGIDPVRIMGSVVSNLTSDSLQGGSTLTQQLVKLSYFSTKSSDQTLKRKAQEAWLAIQLEQKKSKQEILTYYINKVYMANGIYGMETAAQTYYGKTLSELNLPQTALLAGMPQAPSYYDPYENPEAAKERRDTVLYTMLDNEKITQAEYDEAIEVPIDEGLKPLKTTSAMSKIADNFLKEAIAEVEDKTGKDVYTDGMEIHTTLDMDAQERLYEIVNSDQYVDYPDEEMQVASTMIDTQTGYVRAQIGGRNIADDVVFGNNLAVNTARDFGSTVKPITDYGPAFENLKLSSGYRLKDEPYQYEGTDIDVYNWDHLYKGNLTLRSALVQSRNVPAVKLFNEVGADKSLEFLNGLGIDYENITQANAISSNTETQDGTKYGISSLKMAAAYAAFANGGTYYQPQYVTEIVYQDGSKESFEPEGERAMSEGTAYMVTDILKGVLTDPAGTGSNAVIPGLTQAGKTGTSNYTDEELAQINASSTVSPDILYAGYTPSYSISVWTGYNEKLTPITSDATHVASDVYRELMQYVSAEIGDQDWTLPDDLVKVGSELYFKENYTPPSSAKKKASTTRSSVIQTPATSQTVVPPASSTTPATKPSVSQSEPASSESVSSESSTSASSTSVESSVSTESSEASVSVSESVAPSQTAPSSSTPPASSSVTPPASSSVAPPASSSVTPPAASNEPVTSSEPAANVTPSPPAENSGT